MRLLHPGGRHVHVAVAVTGQYGDAVVRLLRLLDETAVTYRQRLGTDLLGISLRLPSGLAALLASSRSLRHRFRRELTARGLEIVTLDAGDQPRRPDTDWRTWVTYLLDLARVLVDVMPDDVDHGTVSSTAPPLDGPRAGVLRDSRRGAARALEDLTTGLAEIAWHTGRPATIALEPAAGSPMTDTATTVGMLAKKVDPARVGVTLNPAQLLSAGETGAQSLALLRRAGLAVAKVRVAGADDPAVLQAARGLFEELFGGIQLGTDHLEVESAADLTAVADDLAMHGLQVGADPSGLDRAA